MFLQFPNYVLYSLYVNPNRKPRLEFTLDLSTLNNRGELAGQLGQFVQYEINDLCLCRLGFYIPDISDSSRTNKFVQNVHVPATSRLA